MHACLVLALVLLRLLQVIWLLLLLHFLASHKARCMHQGRSPLTNTAAAAAAAGAADLCSPVIAFAGWLRASNSRSG
jgi:hypothetical protein